MALPGENQMAVPGDGGRSSGDGQGGVGATHTLTLGGHYRNQCRIHSRVGRQGPHELGSGVPTE